MVFHLVGRETPGVPKPQAQTNAEGRFQLTTLESNDGALPGDYTITVELRDLIIVGEEKTRAGKNLLPPRYASAAITDLKATIAASPTDLPPLQLKSR